MLGRDRRAEQAELAHLLDQRARVGVGVLECQDLRAHVALEPAPDRIQHLALVVVGEPAHAACPALAGMI